MNFCPRTVCHSCASWWGNPGKHLLCKTTLSPPIFVSDEPVLSREQAHLEFAEHMWWSRILSTTASVLWGRSTCPESEMFIMLGTLAKIWYCHSKIVLSLLQLTMLLKYFPLPSSYRAEINRQENKFSQEFFFSHFHGKFTLLIWTVFVFRSSWYVSYPNSLTTFLWTSCLTAYPKAMIIYISTTYKKRLKVKLCLLRENNERTCHCSANSMIVIYTWLLSSFIILSFQKDPSIPRSALWEMMIMWPLLGKLRTRLCLYILPMPSYPFLNVWYMSVYNNCLKPPSECLHERNAKCLIFEG